MQGQIFIVVKEDKYREIGYILLANRKTGSGILFFYLTLASNGLVIDTNISRIQFVSF